MECKSVQGLQGSLGLLRVQATAGAVTQRVLSLWRLEGKTAAPISTLQLPVPPIPAFYIRDLISYLFRHPEAPHDHSIYFFAVAQLCL